MREYRIDHSRSLTKQVRGMGLPERHWSAYYRTFLYRFHSDTDLLYVGVTVSPANRWSSHRMYSAWWPLVDRVTLDLYPHTNAALDAELAAIKTEYPLFNSRSTTHKYAGPFTEHSLNDHCSNHPPFIAGMEEEWNGRGMEKNDGEVGHHPSVRTARDPQDDQANLVVVSP